MVSRNTITALLVVGGLLLVTNPLWLYPNAGEARYTYERSEITVENGALTYDGMDTRGFGKRNDLNPVGCQHYDTDGGRACAFDRHLVDHPPVTVPREQIVAEIRPDFVRIDGAYYRRIHRPSETDTGRTVTHDVERVAPETVLSESAMNVSGISEASVDDLRVTYRVAVTGDTETAFERPDNDDLGNVYLQNGTYYTVVATDQTTFDDGPDFLRYEPPRQILMLLGGLLVVGAIFRRSVRAGE